MDYQSSVEILNERGYSQAIGSVTPYGFLGFPVENVLRQTVK